MRYDQIVRAKGGTDRHIQRVGEIKIPDLWHTATAIEATSDNEPGRQLTKQDVEMVLETWYLCHDLLDHIKRICNESQTGQ